MTKPSKRNRNSAVGAAIVMLAVAGFLAGPVQAEPSCVSGCNAQKKDCVGSTAKPAKLSCKSACGESASRGEKGACVRGCVDEFRTAKASCKTTRSGCKSVCAAGEGGGGSGVDGACVSDCAHQLGDCARGNADTAKACMSACKAEKGPGFPECVQACAGTAAPGAQACNAAFRGCAEGCGATVPTTTLPPGSTTLPGSSTTLIEPPTTVPGASTTLLGVSTTLPTATTTTTLPPP